VPGAATVQYVTRWQMRDTSYYAGVENTALNRPSFYAVKAKSFDLCSVSACFPHVITYPEAGLGGSAETGRIDCPGSPGAASPCTMTIRVRVADIGSPGAASLLEEVGSYAFASTLPSGALTNANAEADNVPLQVDGACCFNFNQAASGSFTCERAEGHGSFQDGDFEFDADGNCDGDGHSDHVTFRDSRTGRSFASTTVASVVYNASEGSMVVTGEGFDSGQTVAYTATFVQAGAASPTSSAALVTGTGLTIGGNLVGAVLDLH